jgi:ethanolamine ammonia-lyase small subunit
MSEPQLPASAPAALPAVLQAVRARTPARILVGRAGPAYRTATALELRHDHAAAVDAVHAELDLPRELVERWRLFEVRTRARDKSEYLMRPDLGRRLDDDARTAVARECAPGADVQVVIGDGLSVAAVAAQVPALLPLLEAETLRRGWTFGRPFAVRYCRGGVLNVVGE